MTDKPPDASKPDETPPGKTRTWWHPLLVNLLRYEFGDSCEVLDEVNVGQLPLRLDVVLIRKRRKPLPATARQHLTALTDRLNRYTLLELKSPTRSTGPISIDCWRVRTCFALSNRNR